MEVLLPRFAALVAGRHDQFLEIILGRIHEVAVLLEDLVLLWDALGQEEVADVVHVVEEDFFEDLVGEQFRMEVQALDFRIVMVQELVQVLQARGLQRAGTDVSQDQGEQVEFNAAEEANGAGTTVLEST